MNTCMDKRLEAWGRMVRGDQFQLKRIRVSQSRYGIEASSDFVEHLEFIQWVDTSGWLIRVPIEEANLAGKIIGALSPEYSDPLRARYLHSGTMQEKAARRGVSVSMFKRQVSAGRVMFEIVWNSLTRKVNQHGAQIQVDVEDYDYPPQN